MCSLAVIFLLGDVGNHFPPGFDPSRRAKGLRKFECSIPPQVGMPVKMLDAAEVGRHQGKDG